MTLFDLALSAPRLAATGLANREVPERDHIPYAHHYDAETLLTKQADLLQIVQIGGFPFETADDELLALRKDLRNALFRSAADSRFAMYVHTVRRRVSEYPDGEFLPGLAAEVDRRWRAKHAAKSMLATELYVTLLRKTTTGAHRAKGSIDRLSHLGSRTERQVALRSAHQELQALSQRFVALLQEYRPRVLGLIRRDGRTYSESLQFIARLINLEDQAIQLPRIDRSSYLPQRRIHFARNAFEIAGASASPPKLGAIVSIKEYGSDTHAGLLDRFLQIPREIVITQSFVFQDRATVLSRMQVRQRRMAQADDLAASQLSKIDRALDDATSGHIGFGHHHLTVMCCEQSLPELDKAVADVEAALLHIGIVPVREDLSLEPAFWAQLPGNFPYIARRALVSTADFAGFASLHNYPRGRPSGNRWGPAVTLLETASGTPYFFNWHRGETGHTLLIGPSGAGKSVAMNFLLAQSAKFQPRVFYFDRDHGAEIFVRALGGAYTAVDGRGDPAFNPLQLSDTPANRAFLERWLGSLVTAFGEPLNAAEVASIAHAVEGNYTLPLALRRLEHVAPFLGIDGPGLRDRLAVWHGNGGRAALFGGVEDRLDLAGRMFGFEMGELLADPIALAPVLLYLFHRIELELDGTPTIIVIEEGGKLLDTPLVGPRIKDWVQTLGKRNAMVVFASPSIQSVVESPIGGMLVQEVATTIFLPNDEAVKKHNRNACKLSKREHHILRSLSPDSHCFLVKHGRDSVVVKLDLTGLEDLIPLLSGNAENMSLFREVLAAAGEDPAVWMPIFQQRLKDAHISVGTR